MARERALEGLTIVELERVLQTRRREASKLQRVRDKLHQKLTALDRKIVRLSGDRLRGAGAGGRVRNDRSLVQSIEVVLGKTSKPMRVGDIVDGVLSSGYRTSSGNFRGIVNQTLIKEKQFSSAGRGLYLFKK